ncbi:MAG: Mut7-C RNAse domain-containing protein [Candidatus Riflebacteria bacterium]|nr:Mut7-C RNAse domain-containing protein [Candidatus Riflebacteria bacterium]
MDRNPEKVLLRNDLSAQLHPFTRCARCNGILERAEKAAVLQLLELKTRLYFTDFFQCRSCQQVYWQGSHFAAIEEFIKRFACQKYQ